MYLSVGTRQNNMYLYIAAFVLLLVIALAGYSFLSHSIEKRRIRHQRLVTALRARRNTFRDLVTGFPGGFLSNDLMALLYRSLIDCCDQLSRLEPKDKTHTDQLAHYTEQLNGLKDQSQQPRVRLENPQQIREARHLLQELLKHVVQQGQLKQLNAVQTAAYVDQIKRLALQTSVDAHIANAKQAQATGKIRLAIHHYGLARKTLLTENISRAYDKQIEQLENLVKKLEEKAAELAAGNKDKNALESSLPNKEWDNLKPIKKDEWKLKQDYD